MIRSISTVVRCVIGAVCGVTVCSQAVAFDITFSGHACVGKRPSDKNGVLYTTQGVRNITRKDIEIICFAMQEPATPVNNDGDKTLALTIKGRYRENVTKRPMKAWLNLYDEAADRTTGRSISGTLPSAFSKWHPDVLNISLPYQHSGTINPTLRILLPAGAELNSVNFNNTVK